MKEKKHSIFSVSNLVVALLCFTAFLVAGILLYYAKVPYLTFQVWALCVILAAVGAVSMFLHWYRFALLYYVGCALGWFAGQLVGQLQGDEFTSNMWKIVTFAVIVVFAVLGLILQMKSFKKKRDRRKEEKAAVKAEAEAKAEADRLAAELEAARKEKEAAEAALEAAAAAPGPQPEASAPTEDAEENT